MDTIFAWVSDDSDNYKTIEKAGSIIKSGGLVAFPTETVYGLGANALDEKAVTKIFEAKGRPQDNPLIIHINYITDLQKYAYVQDDRVYKLLERFWPGPLTVVLKKRSIVPDIISAGLDTVAVRCPSHPIARALINSAGVPIAAPSANTSGRPSPTKASHVYSDLNGKIDMILDGGSCDIGVESTVLSLAAQAPVLLRPGGVTLEELEEVLGRVETDRAVFEKIDALRKVSSPGMKYRHYAPRAKVIAITGNDRAVIGYINKNLKNKTEKTGVLCYTGEEKKFKNADMVISYGKKKQPVTLTQNLFDALRAFDETDVQLIFARCPGTKGLGLAVSNRIMKAAGFERIDL